jgi:SulP family sulfate permease
MIREWMLLLGTEFKGYGWAEGRKDLLAGLAVAAVALPLALAFGVASGADASAGLVTAIVAGILIGALGGAPYQISGPTGAMSAVLIVLAARHGMAGVWVAGLLAGAMMILLGVLKLGRVVSLIPAPVISGFTSGIALIIALGQIDNILGLKTVAAENIIQRVNLLLHSQLKPNPEALVLSVASVALMLGWPRLPVSRWIPASLTTIAAATAFALIAGWDVAVIGEVPRSIVLEHNLSMDAILHADFSALLVPAMSIAALGTIESLLCGAVAGNITGIRMHNSIELIAQGIGNMLIPFFGGVPATAAIARTSVNVKSGSVTRLSSVFHGLTLLAFALLFAPIIGRIPLASLAGVLVVTAWRMNEWHAIRFYFSKRLKHAIIAFSLTLAATVVLDLTQAIVIGFGISSLIFMAQMSDLQITRQTVDLQKLEAAGHRFVHPEHPIAVYYLSGPLFFAAARKLVDQVHSNDEPSATVILSMRGVPLVDATGVEVLREILRRQSKRQGKLLLASLQPRVESVLSRTGFLVELGPNSVYWSTDRAILSLGLSLPETEAKAEMPPSPLVSTLVITSHEGRMEQKL